MTEDRAISLNAVLDVMHEMWGDSGELLDAIKELPPVTPKTGHWIKDGIGTYPYKCDSCSAYHRALYDFCPSCGSYNGGDNNADSD